LLFDGELTRDWLSAYFDYLSAEWAKERAFIRDYSQRLPDPRPPLSDEAYCGAYYSRYFGPLWITKQAGGLTMQLGPNASVFPLSHWDGNLFTFETTGENALGLSGADFEMGPWGSAKAVILERYNKYGQGVFRRIYRSRRRRITPRFNGPCDESPLTGISIDQIGTPVSVRRVVHP
jgi:hypothetical protein